MYKWKRTTVVIGINNSDTHNKSYIFLKAFKLSRVLNRKKNRNCIVFILEIILSLTSFSAEIEFCSKNRYHPKIKCNYKVEYFSQEYNCSLINILLILHQNLVSTMSNKTKTKDFFWFVKI
ncbi:hypothetical protein QTP88_008433 [Uroleucon formosanum]